MAYHAEGAEADGLHVRIAAEQFPDDAAEVLGLRPDALDHDGIQRLGRFNHLPRDELAMPGITALVENT
ncbi:MAG: hypothetical protein EBS05_25490 [Proteobacteria bacterium]|nr:hypothetical protein [Pseudomonadota bacterium]